MPSPNGFFCVIHLNLLTSPSDFQLKDGTLHGFCSKSFRSLYKLGYILEPKTKPVGHMTIVWAPRFFPIMNRSEILEGGKHIMELADTVE